MLVLSGCSKEDFLGKPEYRLRIEVSGVQGKLRGDIVTSGGTSAMAMGNSKDLAVNVPGEATVDLRAPAQYTVKMHGWKMGQMKMRIWVNGKELKRGGKHLTLEDQQENYVMATLIFDESFKKAGD